ncbi:serine protease 58-like isoform X2 [Erinaceus europaeus]|uniref:Serine protease 58-like isoform X2 n=1 Tax=Erinaceus europaeus TaxID=9365 RepID=A0ABM3WCD0_ERIEU|nr:serine protease 58-like isoform X2 [Erinaceus europaeus]
MNHHFLILTIPTAIVMTMILSPAQAQNQAETEQGFQHMHTDMKATFLIFLSMEDEYCLGTLIHKQWILTAAHCYLPFIEMNIASNEEFFYSDMGELKFLLSVQHPNFSRDSAEHDLMLIKLETPVELNKQLTLAVLPTATDGKTGENCTVSGWGWTWRTPFTSPDIQVEQKVLWFSEKYCQKPPTRQIPVEVTGNMFCAGVSLDTMQSCTEITAAPILCRNQLQGILSWSEGCVLKGDVGYYTKISRYTDWILRVIHTH